MRDPEEILDVPEKLQQALKNLPRKQIIVAPSMDRVILDQVQGILAPPPSVRIIPWRKPVVVLAIAATVALLVFLPRLLTRVEDDFNRDGLVDVMDALQLQLAAEKGGSSPSMDLNRDGRADVQDTRLLLSRLVKF